MNYQKVEFIVSAADRRQLPQDGLPQIAFAGKSNVGKSSVLNCVLQRKNFAYTGSSPGKTAQINFFKVENMAYLVDLPGYGYAKVSYQEQERWGRLMDLYFASGLISLGVFIVDARHAPTQNDVIMANWFQQTGCPFVVLANKIDKLKKSEIKPNLACIQEKLNLSVETVLLPFSSIKRTGREELVRLIDAAAISAKEGRKNG